MKPQEKYPLKKMMQSFEAYINQMIDYRFGDVRKKR